MEVDTEGCGLTFWLIIFTMPIVALVSINTGNTPSAEVDHSWVPEGFIHYNNQVAIRWTPKGQFSCQRRTRCLQLEVVPRIGCSYLYARVSLLDSARNNIGFANTSTAGVIAGQKALMMLSTYNDSAKQFSPPYINCR